ncbi:MAG: site-2 protease family protein [Dehalococcoidia bacterium]|nr:site-2 protease family protein [Dehalococcoidia bacterium]
METLDRTSSSPSPAVALDQSEALVAGAAEVLGIRSIRHLRVEKPSRIPRSPAPTLEIRGRLLMESGRAYEIVAARFRDLGHLALLRQEDGDDLILAVPGTFPTASGKPWVAIGLFFATLVSVVWVGATNEQTVDSGLDLLSGLPFALSLLGILLAHELGHYFTAKRLGVPTSLPYFIPLPVSIFGTMGALIGMKAPPQNRRKLFAVAIAGPLAGLVVTLPILVVGLMLSSVGSLPPGAHYIQEGNSLAYAGLKYLVFGQLLPSGGVDVFLHPVALAGWAGLLVTGLNLIPAGQLDGGHIVYALLGHRVRWLTTAVILTLVTLGIFWQGWLLWAALIFLFGRAQATPFDDVTPLGAGQRVLAIIAIVVFLLIFSPIPLVVG